MFSSLIDFSKIWAFLELVLMYLIGFSFAVFVLYCIFFLYMMQKDKKSDTITKLKNQGF